VAVPAIRRMDAAYRQRQRDKVSRIANSLGSIGELFLKKAEREREIKQQELENQIKLRQIALQEAQGKVSQQNADTAASNLSQRVEEHNLAVRKYNDQRGDSSAEAIEVEKTRAGLYQAVETIKGTLSEEDKVKLDGLLATNSSVEESIIRRSLGLPEVEKGASVGSTGQERSYDRYRADIFTPDPSTSLLSLEGEDIKKGVFNRKVVGRNSFGMQAMDYAMKGASPDEALFRNRLYDFAKDNLGEGRMISGFPKEPDEQQRLASDMADYLYQNSTYYLANLQTTMEAPKQNTPPPSPPPEEDPLVRLERMLSQ